MKSFDAVVIGAGQAGVPLAKKLAAAGWKTALIEKRLVGGTCINDGCTPTKALVASARMAHLAAGRKELGVETGGVKLNFTQVMRRKDAIVSQFRSATVKGIEQVPNLKLIYGAATFTANHELRVRTDNGLFEKLTAERIFINTGAEPFIPEIKGIGEIRFLTSTSILELKEVPEHLLIVGGGYIGLEFGQMFSRFGSRVTILEQGERLLPREDEDACEVMAKVFQEEGIILKVKAKVVRFENYGTNRIRVSASVEDKTENYTCSHVLIASGRKPQTSELGLANTDVVCDQRGFIQVNDRLETSVKEVYALGDVKGGPAFTHISYNDHVVLVNNLLHHAKEKISGRVLPYCMFTDPQMGRVGLNEMEAKAAGRDYLVAKIPMRQVARAIETGETKGFMKAIVDKKSKLILGATVIGEIGGEIMSLLQMAMAGKITYEEIRYMIFAHPLYAESLNNLFMTLDD